MARAKELLTRDRLGSPSHIIIHTGTNDIWIQEAHEMVTSTKEMIEKAISTFPNAKVVISALLHRGDVEPDYINTINAQTSRTCATERNVYFAKHPQLHKGSLHDKVHLRKALIPIFAKSLKDVALARDNPTDPTSYRHNHHRQTLHPEDTTLRTEGTLPDPLQDTTLLRPHTRVAHPDP